MSFQIGRNDRCWCGSGRKFKKCHLHRSNEKRLPFAAIKNEIRQASQGKVCLHPAAGRDCGRIINAHTIQRSLVLARIINANNRVLTFYQSLADDDGRFQPRSVGWKEASTFTGFCATHDHVFAPIETAPFANTPEQRFLVAYRAICHEFYQKEAALRTESTLRDLIDRSMSVSEQRLAQEKLRWQMEGVRGGSKWARACKEQMDRELLAGDFGKLSSFTVSFRGPLCTASTGVVTPANDVKGRALQVLHDSDAEPEVLFFGLIATDGGGTAVCGWRPEHKRVKLFVESLADQGANLSSALVQFMFAHIENTFFSEEWWNGLTGEQRATLSRHAANFNPYYCQPVYIDAPLVPWTVTSAALAAAV
jgi:SEC-C motif